MLGSYHYCYFETLHFLQIIKRKLHFQIKIETNTRQTSSCISSLIKHENIH